MKQLLITISLLCGISTYGIGPERGQKTDSREVRDAQRGGQPIARRLPGLAPVRPTTLVNLVNDQRTHQRSIQELQHQLRNFTFVDENGNNISIQDIIRQAETMQREAEDERDDLSSSSDSESSESDEETEFSGLYPFNT